jgi:hypothetical protein
MKPCELDHESMSKELKIKGIPSVPCPNCDVMIEGAEKNEG